MQSLTWEQVNNSKIQIIHLQIYNVQQVNVSPTTGEDVKCKLMQKFVTSTSVTAEIKHLADQNQQWLKIRR